MTERERFSAYILQEYNSDVVWHEGNPIKAMDLMLWLAWQAATQRDGFKFVPMEPTIEMLEDAGDEHVLHGASYAGIYKAMIGVVDE